METSNGKGEPGGRQGQEPHRWLFLRRDPAFLDSIRRLYDPPGRLINPYVQSGNVVVDLGCGTGYFTFCLAERVGPGGKVYGIDLDEGCIRRIRRKASKLGYSHLEAHASSAASIGFIPDRSIDFVLANGLLCSMQNDRHGAVSEIKRILRQDGRAYLSLGMPPPFGLVNRLEWELILAGFKVLDGGSWEQRWALVGLR